MCMQKGFEQWILMLSVAMEARLPVANGFGSQGCDMTTDPGAITHLEQGGEGLRALWLQFQSGKVGELHKQSGISVTFYHSRSSSTSQNNDNGERQATSDRAREANSVICCATANYSTLELSC